MGQEKREEGRTVEEVQEVTYLDRLAKWALCNRNRMGYNYHGDILVYSFRTFSGRQVEIYVKTLCMMGISRRIV